MNNALRITHYVLILAALWLSPLSGELEGSASAQIKLGVKAGVDLMQLSNDKEFIDAKYRSGFHLGPTIKVDIPSTSFGADISLILDQRSAEVTSYQSNMDYMSDFFEPGNIVAERKTDKLTCRTLNIPLNIRFYVLDLKALDVFVKAGPQLTTYLGDKKVIEGVTDFKDEWADSEYYLNLGGGFTISKQLEVSANCNIFCGKTKDAKLSDTFEQAKQAVKHNVKKLAWQISAAWYF